MNYEQFISAMLKCTRNKLPDSCFVDRQEVLKNNGVVMSGLSIREGEKEIAPVVYLEEYYQSYLRGYSVENLSDRLIERSKSASDLPQWNSKQFLDFHLMKDKIVYKLVNAEKNETLLKEVPNLPILDFAIVFHLYLPISEKESGSVLIRNVHMNLWKRPVSVLYDHAKVNTPRLCPHVLCLLSDMIKMPEISRREEDLIFVLTNEAGVNGAASLLYPEMPTQIYKMVGGSYYLLPSSIHEFLIVPERAGIVPSELRAIVREVNRTEIAPEEFLSDQIYYFNGDIITKI